MNLYILERKTASYQQGVGTYDQAISFVIRASSPNKARKIAAALDQSGCEGPEVWLNPELSFCKKLLHEGKEGVILRDLHEG